MWDYYAHKVFLKCSLKCFHPSCLLYCFNVSIEFVLIYHRHQVDFERHKEGAIIADFANKRKRTNNVIFFTFSCSEVVREHLKQVCASCSVKGVNHLGWLNPVRVSPLVCLLFSVLIPRPLPPAKTNSMYSFLPCKIGGGGRGLGAPCIHVRNTFPDGLPHQENS